MAGQARRRQSVALARLAASSSVPTSSPRRPSVYFPHVGDPFTSIAETGLPLPEAPHYSPTECMKQASSESTRREKRRNSEKYG